MRKMMNKKGFSLVELMIVVVIMGILIAVAIPLYGAITENAEKKTCANNIKVITNTCSNYYVSTDPQAALKDAATLKGMMEEEEIPACPLGGTYGIYTSEKDGRAIVVCPNATTDDDDSHLATDVGSGTAPSTEGYNTIQTAAKAE